MARGVEAVVQVAPDSTGKKLRTQEYRVVNIDGSEATVEVQVTHLVDAEGNIVNPDTSHMLDRLTEIAERLQEITGLLYEVLQNDLRQGIAKKAGHGYSTISTRLEGKK